MPSELNVGTYFVQSSSFKMSYARSAHQSNGHGFYYCRGAVFCRACVDDNNQPKYFRVKPNHRSPHPCPSWWVLFFVFYFLFFYFSFFVSTFSKTTLIFLLLVMLNWKKRFARALVESAFANTMLEQSQALT